MRMRTIARVLVALLMLTAVVLPGAAGAVAAEEGETGDTGQPNPDDGGGTMSPTGHQAAGATWGAFSADAYGM